MTSAALSGSSFLIIVQKAGSQLSCQQRHSTHLHGDVSHTLPARGSVAGAQGRSASLDDSQPGQGCQDCFRYSEPARSAEPGGARSGWGETTAGVKAQPGSENWLLRTAAWLAVVW